MRASIDFDMENPDLCPINGAGNFEAPGFFTGLLLMTIFS